MHVAPFIFSRPAGSFMGYLLYKNSRRNKADVQVYINTGAGNEYIGDLPIDSKGHEYIKMFALWAYEHGHMDDWFEDESECSLPYSLPQNYKEEDFLNFLKTRKAEIRFW